MKIVLFFLLLSSFSFAQSGFGELQGTIVDQDGELLSFTRVIVYDNEDAIIGGAQTDFDGRFRITGIVPGDYIVKINDFDEELVIGSVTVQQDRITNLGEIIFTLPEIIGCDFGIRPPLIRLEDFFGGPTIIKSEDIRIRY